jgi:hypothetical protein
MSVLSRREALFAGIAAWAPLRSAAACNERILAAPDLLSQESAAGYRAALPSGGNVLVAIGHTWDPLWMERRARAGATLIHELPVACYQANDAEYIRYHWPSPALIRHFGSGAASTRNPGQAIAYFGGRAVAWRRTYGKGCIVTLASLLGPHLLAGDRDALRLLQEMASVRS